MRLVRYISCFSSVSAVDFNTRSFQRDKHAPLFESTGKLSCSLDDVADLRTECLTLILAVADKYKDYIAQRFDYNDKHHCSCCSNNNNLDDLFLPRSDIESISESEASLTTNTSDSSYSGSEISQDDNSVGGLHSDYNTLLKDYNTLHHENSTKNECNLLCPGDMIEYYRVNDRSYIRRESITELCDSKISQYRKIQLKDGQTLYAGTHVLLRKIQSYCPDTKQLIPNPLGEWQTIEECMIQPGTIVDGNIVIDADVEPRKCAGVTQFT